MVTFRDVVIGVVPVELATAMNSPNILGYVQLAEDRGDFHRLCAR